MLVEQAGTTMHDIVSSIRRVTHIMSETSAASNEQSIGVSRHTRAGLMLSRRERAADGDPDGPQRGRNGEPEHGKWIPQ